MNAGNSRVLAGISVAGREVQGVGFQGGVPLDFEATVLPDDRRLDGAKIRRGLPAAPVITSACDLDVIVDCSGSLDYGNDVQGTRHEALLIAVEHLARSDWRRSRWNLRVTAFDHGSPMELPWTRLDRAGLRLVAGRLLVRPGGGSSNLGPALRRTESSARRQPRLLIVLSDFELFDPRPAAVIQELDRCSATEVLAVVFKSIPPTELSDGRVVVEAIDPERSSPDDIARSIVEAAIRLAARSVTP